MCNNANPAYRYSLEKVDAHFVELFQIIGIAKPRLHISTAAIANLPNSVSIRFLLRRLGRNCGVIVEVKNVIRETRWVNCWLWLRLSGIGW